MRCLLCNAPACRVYQPTETSIVVGHCFAARCQRAVILAAERFPAVAEALARIFYIPRYEAARGTCKPGTVARVSRGAHARKHLIATNSAARHGRRDRAVPR